MTSPKRTRRCMWQLLLLGALVALGPGALAPTAAQAGEALATGLLPTPPEEYAEYPAWQPARAAPRPGQGGGDAVVDLRPYAPPVGDQGRQGSCVGWAVAYGAQSYLEAVRRGRPPGDASRQMSPAFLYNQINGGKDQGSQFPDALALARDLGAVPLTTLPYSDRDFQRQPDGDTLLEAADLRAFGYARLTSREDIRNALAMRLPVVIAMETSPRFMEIPARWEVYRLQDWRDGVAHRRANQPHGLHAVLLVGYDDRRGAFLMQNSWGTAWGRGGYAWLDYDLFHAIHPDANHAIREAWVLFSGRQVHPRAAEALNVPASLQGSLWVDTSVQREPDGTWGWEVRVTPDEQPIARIDWTWTDAAGRRQGAGGRGGDDLVVAGRSRDDGVFDVHGTVHFAGGGTQGITARVYPAERLRPLRIRFRDRYWGRQNGAPQWLWWANLGGPEEEMRRVRRVTWELGPTYPNPRIVQTPATPGGFRISGRASRPTRLDAIVELDTGGGIERRRIRSATAFFSSVEDQLRVEAYEGEDEQGPFLALMLRGPGRELDPVAHVVWSVEGETPARVDADEDDTAFATDLRLAAPPRRPLALRAELVGRDGRRRTVEGRFTPVGR